MFKKFKVRRKIYPVFSDNRDKLFSSFFCFLIILCLLTSPSLSVFANEETDGKRAEELRKELSQKISELSEQIEKYRDTIKEIQKQSDSLEREVGLLDNQIGKFELEIRRINLIIANIQSQIEETELKIKELEQKTENEKIILGELIREIYKHDDTSVLEIVLTKDNLSDFFSELQSLENVQLGIHRSLEEIRALKEELEDKKAGLEEQKKEMMALKAIQETQKYSIGKKRSKRNNLLKETKGEEFLYQKLVQNKQTDINKIRSQLFVLQGMGGSLSFENALEIAEFASSITGVRPAFLLAVLSKESGWGANVGTGTWRVDMSPRQHSAYLTLCKKLGFDPDTMPVSKKAWYGWGGAMGPAQFIPATWLGYESRIAAATGHNPPNPWDMDDAFAASALYLTNAGAAAQTYRAEHKAYMVYLAGGNWQKSYLQFYGDQVMDLASKIQHEINLIKQSTN